jgi:hypothetical protein
MRRVPDLLIILGVISFLMGTSRAFFGRVIVGYSRLAVSPETYWRGAAFLVLLAIALLLLERRQASG